MHQSIHHENIFRMYETIEVNPGEMATVLELCEGPDLSSYMKRTGPLQEKDAKPIIRQVLQALKYIDEFKTGKIIHFDLKPGNILIKDGIVKVADFGLCKELKKDAFETDLTSFGTGTYWYLPPEAFQEDPHNPPQITTKLDIWSVGVIYYELLFGKRPYGHGIGQKEIMSNKIILKASKVEFPPKPTVSIDARTFISNCLAYTQEDRFDVHAALDFLNNPQKQNQSQGRD